MNNTGEPSNISNLSRRKFLAGAGTVAGTLLLPAGVARAAVSPSSSEHGGGLFSLGVASGDPLPRQVVIWTRLAPKPLELDSGMSGWPVWVEWEVARDENFASIVNRGWALAAEVDGYAVHVDVTGLEPHSYYWYRFRAAGEISPVGRTRTAPAYLSAPDITFGFVSCSQYEHGYFTGYRRLAEDNPDVVFCLGDYIYEYDDEGYQLDEGNVRSHVGPEIVTLADYRRRYAQYKTDPDLQAAHAAAPWIVTWDDHEVDNNFAGTIPENNEAGEGNDNAWNFANRRAAAFKAYWENMPLRWFRRPSMFNPNSLPLYRRFHFGTTASFSVLDTRQYRTDQPCNDEFANPCGEENDPNATILGDEQATWLEHGLAYSWAKWQVVPQQIFLSNLDAQPGAGNAGYTDGWDGYRASRQRLINFVDERQIDNFVVLTGDIHASFLSDIKTDWENPDSKTVGTELVGTSITSGGDGSDQSSFFAALQTENPHLRYNSNRRGYVMCKTTTEEMTVNYRAVDQVSVPGAQVRNDKSFVIESGDPVAKEV